MEVRVPAVELPLHPLTSVPYVLGNENQQMWVLGQHIQLIMCGWAETLDSTQWQPGPTSWRQLWNTLCTKIRVFTLSTHTSETLKQRNRGMSTV
jgi:hypothetical protein